MIDGESWRTARPPTGPTLRVAETRGTGRRSLTCLGPSRLFGGGKGSPPDRCIPYSARVMGGDLDGGRLIGVGCVRLNDTIHGRRRAAQSLASAGIKSATEHAAEERFSAVETLDLGLLANRHPMTNQTYRVSATPSCTAPRRAACSIRVAAAPVPLHARQAVGCRLSGIVAMRRTPS
jgi:hypothetical protein